MTMRNKFREGLVGLLITAGLAGFFGCKYNDSNDCTTPTNSTTIEQPVGQDQTTQEEKSFLQKVEEVVNEVESSHFEYNKSWEDNEFSYQVNMSHEIKEEGIQDKVGINISTGDDSNYSRIKVSLDADKGDGTIDFLNISSEPIFQEEYKCVLIDGKIVLLGDKGEGSVYLIEPSNNNLRTLLDEANNSNTLEELLDSNLIDAVTKSNQLYNFKESTEEFNINGLFNSQDFDIRYETSRYDSDTGNNEEIIVLSNKSRCVVEVKENNETISLTTGISGNTQVFANGTVGGDITFDGTVTNSDIEYSYESSGELNNDGIVTIGKIDEFNLGFSLPKEVYRSDLSTLEGKMIGILNSDYYIGAVFVASETTISSLQLYSGEDEMILGEGETTLYTDSSGLEYSIGVEEVDGNDIVLNINGNNTTIGKSQFKEVNGVGIYVAETIDSSRPYIKGYTKLLVNPIESYYKITNWTEEEVSQSLLIGETESTYLDFNNNRYELSIANIDGNQALIYVNGQGEILKEGELKSFGDVSIELTDLTLPEAGHYGGYCRANVYSNNYEPQGYINIKDSASNSPIVKDIQGRQLKGIESVLQTISSNSQN